MPIYKIQAPDGNIYRIEGPPNASDEDLFRTVAEQTPMAAKTTEELQKEKSAPTSISDIARSFGSGVVGAGKSLVDVFGTGSDVSKYLGGLNEEIQKGLTPERQAEMARRAELSKRAEKEGTFAQIKSGIAGVLEAPLQSIAQGVGSSLPTIAAGLAALPLEAPALLGIGVQRASQVLIAAAQGTGEVKGDIHDAIKQAYLEKNYKPEDAERLAIEAQEYTLKNAPKLIGGAAFGALDALTGFERSTSQALKNALTPEKKAFTKEGLQAAIAQLPEKAAQAPTYLGQAVKTGFEEAVPEGLQGGYGQLAQNLAMDEAGFSTPTFQGVAGAAARDALVGALTGTAMSPLGHSVAHAEYEADKYLRGVKAQQEFETQREEFAKQQQQTKENLGVGKTLALGYEPKAEEEKYTNPAATIKKNELMPDEVKFVDDYRRQNGLPPLKSYSIEDIKDAMPGVDPEGEQGRIDSILAAKYGYKPVDDNTGKPVNYTPEDVISAAEDEKNIATGTKGFADFLTRTTGSSDLNTMTQPQLFAAFQAIKQMPESEEKQILPEGTGASRFTDKQYKKAVSWFGQTFEGVGNQPLSRDTIITDIQEATGLEQKHDAEALLDTAVKNGDLAETEERVFRTYDDNGKLVSTYRDKAKADAAAKKQGLNVKEETLKQLIPPPQAEPAKRANLPAGYEMTKETVKEGEVPVGFEIFPEGRGKALVTVPTQEELQVKIESLTGARQKEAAKALANMDRDVATLKRARENLESMEARGEVGSQAYELAKTRLAKQERVLGKRIERHMDRIAAYNEPLKSRPTEAKKQVTREKITVTKQGKSLGSFPDNVKAQEAILVQMTDDELAATAADGRLGAIADRAAKELERRKQPAGIAVKRSPKKEEELPPLSPELQAAADEISKRLVPLLQRMGLGSVGLKIVESIKNGAEGSYTKNLIKLAIDAGENAVEVMHHEALHALKDLGFFTDQQWATLERQADKTWIDKYLKNVQVEVDGKTMSRYDGYVYLNKTQPEEYNKANPDKPQQKVMSDADLQALLREEAIADAFADFATTKPPGGMISSILKRLNDLFRAIKNAFNRSGFETAEDIFGKAQRGELRGTTAGTEAEKASLRNTTKGLLNPNILPKYEKIINDVADEMELTPEEFASTSLIHQTGKAGVEQFEADKVGGLPEVVQFLQDERRKSGVPLLSVDNPKDRRTIAKLMATEAMAAIRSGGANLEWYDSVINKTLAMAGLKYQELNTDVNARSAFRIATAITSQGLNVEDNLAFAMKVYEQFRPSGRFPEIGQGADQSAMVSNFKLANYLLEDMGPDLMRQFLETEFTVDEMRSAGFNIKGELGDEKVLGSSVFGPKIGFGFYSNLNGNFEPVTMDMWFMRTIGRLTGNLKAFRQELYDAQLAKFRDELDTEGSNGVFANQFDQDEIELAKVDDAAAEALARKVKSAHERDFKNNRVDYDNGVREKSKLVGASETMIKSLDAPKDAPSNGTERRNLRDIVNQMVDIVEEKYGKRVPPASLQAVIWYPEQELYKALGVKLRVTSQNYAGAIKKILTGEGYGESELESAAKLGSRTAQQLAKTAVSKGAKTAGAQPVRLGALQTAEKEKLLERGRKRAVLEQERETPRRKRVIFEVAPDPNNKALTNKWRSLSTAQRIDISDRIGNKIIKDALERFGLTGYVDTQVGSYLDDTNPSFALYLDSGDSVAMANFLGYALSQDSMMVVSPKEGKGLSETGAVRVELGDASAAEVDKIYQKLREIEVNGEKPVGGQSFMNGHMVILNYSDVPTEELAKLVNDKLEDDYNVVTDTVYTAFPEKKDYDYANPSSDPRGNAGVLRQASRNLRAEATKLLQKELRKVEPEPETGEDAKLSLKTIGLTDERINKLIDDNIYLQNGAEKKTKAYIAYVSPKDFLNATIPLSDKEKLESEKEPLDIDRLRKESQPINLEVEPTEGRKHELTVRGHEGRHRMMALRDAGFEKVPVVFQFVRGEDRESIDDLYIHPQKFDKDEYGIRGFVAYGLEPINYENRNVIKQKFSEGEVKYSLRSTRQPPESKEFKQWFTGSYFTSNGEPLIMYHGTARDITQFKGKQAGAIFVTTKPEVAHTYADMGVDYMRVEAYKALTREEKVDLITTVAEQAERDGTINAKELKEITSELKKRVPAVDPEKKRIVGLPYQIEGEIIESLNNLLPTKGNIMPVYVNAKNVFDYANKDDVNRVYEWMMNNSSVMGRMKNADNWLNSVKGQISRGLWTRIESEPVQEAIRALGFDGFSVLEAGSKNYAVYNPTAIKSVTGNIGTYGLGEISTEQAARLGMTPEQARQAQAEGDIRLSLRNSVSPQINAAIDRATYVREQKGFAERMMDAISPKSWSDFRSKAMNRYNAMSVADKKRAEKMGGAALLADQSAEAAALMSDLAAGVTASALGVHDRHGGAPVFRNGITTIDGSIKGPVAIFAPLAKYGDPRIYQMWQFYAGAKRARRFFKDNREQNYTPADLAYADQLVNQYPEFKQIFDEWNKFNDALVQYQVDTGVLSKSMADEYRKYSDYIPFYRQLEDEQTLGPKVFQSISAVKIGKKLEGSPTAIADLMETIVRNVQSGIQAGMKNTAAQRAVKVFEDIGEAVPTFPSDTNPSVVHVLENGQKKAYIVADPALYNSMQSLNLPELPFLGFFAGPANLLRNLVTKDPGFMLANMVRDSMSAWVTSGVKMTPIASAVKNFTGALRGTAPEYQALLNAGILGGYEFSQNVEASGKQLKKELAKYGPSTSFGKITKPFTSVWEALEKGTTASDAATRMEVYKNVLAETGNEAEALFRALEVMNFNRKGSSAVIRIMTAAVPFLNARIQGLDVLYRAAFGKMATQDAKAIQKSFFIRGATIMALSMIYWGLTHDDDDYKKQEQETRDNNWLIPSLGIKIPIPFEVGVIFKVIPERIAAYSFGTDTGKDFADAMKRNFMSTFAFNPIPQVVLPIVEAKTNYSFFTNRAIVGQGLEGVAKEFQVGPNTSRLAKWLGSVTGESPMMIDHIIGGYTGTFGMYAVDAIDAITASNSDVPRASKRFEQMPVIRRFLLDPEARGNVTAYYDLKNSVDEAVRTSNFLERTMNFENLSQYSQETIKMLASADLVKSMDKDMKELNEAATAIRSSNMDADTKRDLLTSLNQAQNNITANIKLFRKSMD